MMGWMNLYQATPYTTWLLISRSGTACRGRWERSLRRPAPPRYRSLCPPGGAPDVRGSPRESSSLLQTLVLHALTVEFAMERPAAQLPRQAAHRLLRTVAARGVTQALAMVREVGSLHPAEETRVSGARGSVTMRRDYLGKSRKPPMESSTPWCGAGKTALSGGGRSARFMCFAGRGRAFPRPPHPPPRARERCRERWWRRARRFGRPPSCVRRRSCRARWPAP